MKNLVKIGALGALGAAAYLLWKKAEYEREEREIWAEVAASFDEFPDHETGNSPVRYR